MIKYNKFTEKFEILNASMLSFLTLPSNQIKNMYFSNRFIEIDKDLVYIITKDYLPYYEKLDFYSNSKDEVNIIDNINEANKEILFPVSEFNGIDGSVDLRLKLDFPHIKTLRVSYTIIPHTDSNGVVWGAMSATSGNGIRSRLGTRLIINTDNNTPDSTSISSPIVQGAPARVIESYNFDTLTIELMVNNVTYTGNIRRPTELFDMWLGSYDYPNFKSKCGLSDFKVEIDGIVTLQTPLPHLGVGFDAQGNKVDLTVSGGVTEGFDKEGSKWLQEKGCVKTPDVIPNNQFKEEVVKGISIPPTVFLNTSPFEIDFSSSPFFDKSNPLIWKQIIRDSVYYDKDNPFIWNQKELNQKQFYENVFDDYKYLFWLNIKGNKYLEMFFYKEALDAKDVCHLKNYVKVGEKISLIKDKSLICKTDIII